jgi:hypothetical protein
MVFYTDFISYYIRKLEEVLEPILISNFINIYSAVLNL